MTRLRWRVAVGDGLEVRAWFLGGLDLRTGRLPETYQVAILFRGRCLRLWDEVNGLGVLN